MHICRTSQFRFISLILPRFFAQEIDLGILDFDAVAVRQRLSAQPLAQPALAARPGGGV